MKISSTRRRIAILATFVASIGLIAAACTPGPPPSKSFKFQGTSVTAASQTEFLNIGGCTWITSNCYDEPYLVNIWFRVTIGQPGSADAGVVSTRSASPEVTVCATSHQPPCDAGSETEALLPGADKSGGTVTFPNVSRPDILDLANNNKLDVVGVWSWAMEEDLIGTPTPGTLASLLKSVLNSTLAAGSLPSDPNAIGQLIVDNLGSAIALGGASLANLLSGFLFGAGDDLLGSRMYVFVGAKGTLASILNSVNINLAGFNLNVQAAGIPNVAGVTVRATTSTTFMNQAFVGSGADHRYNFSAS